MPKHPNERLIGIFIITGITAFVLAMGFFLREKIFTGEDRMLVMYFEESMKGLNVGSPVVFKGVEIGKVAKIDLIADMNNTDFRIPVYAKMEAQQGINPYQKSEDRREVLNALIAKGLRARLTSQSLLTGQLMIELEMLPDTPVVLRKRRNNDILEIPTVLSPIGELSKGLQELPIRQSVENFNTFFTELNRQLPITMPKINNAFENFNKMVTTNDRVMTDALENMSKAASSANEAAKAFRNFADYIERHPEALIKGKGYNK